MDKGDIFAMSRIQSDQELLVIACPNPFIGWDGWVDIEADLARSGADWKVVYSSLARGGTFPQKLVSPNHRAVKVSLKSNEAVVLVPT